MRVVLDTNIFVSGVLWKGIPSKIVTAWSAGQFTLAVTAPIIEEYTRVLARLATTPILSSNARTYLDALGINSIFVKPMRLTKQICDDRNDDKFIEAALAADAQYIVTGDAALLRVSKYGAVDVVTARTFFYNHLR